MLLDIKCWVPELELPFIYRYKEPAIGTYQNLERVKKENVPWMPTYHDITENKKQKI